MNENLKERALAELKESMNFSKAQKADKEKRNATVLESLMDATLETKVDTEGKNEVTIDGLTFRASVVGCTHRLQFITQCSKNHGPIFTSIGQLKDLGYYIDNPPSCPACEEVAEPEKAIGEKLVDLIVEISREQ